jgi:transposase
MAISYDPNGRPIMPRAKKTETRLRIRHRPDEAMLGDIVQLWRGFGTRTVAQYYNVSARSVHAWLDKARDIGILSRDEFRAGVGSMSDAKLVDQLRRLYLEAERRGLNLPWKKIE